jgi:hypothetical protein
MGGPSVRGVGGSTALAKANEAAGGRGTLAALFTLALASLGAAGCLSPSAGGGTGTFDASFGDDGNVTLPVQTEDGAVAVDSAAPNDASLGADASAIATFVSGLGSSVVAHSAHFTVVTKTGELPGGAGVKSSAHFTLVSGAAAAGTKSP